MNLWTGVLELKRKSFLFFFLKFCLKSKTGPYLCRYSVWPSVYPSIVVRKRNKRYRLEINNIYNRNSRELDKIKNTEFLLNRTYVSSVLFWLPQWPFSHSLSKNNNFTIRQNIIDLFYTLYISFTCIYVSMWLLFC